MKDRKGKNIIEHCLVKYQVGTPYEAIFKLVKDKKGVLRFHFPKGDGHDMEGMCIKQGWSEKSDSKISEIVFSPADYHTNTICYASCSDGISSDVSEVNGICPDCGEPTVDGDSARGCGYSPLVCETCGDRPCDGSC